MDGSDYRIGSSGRPYNAFSIRGERETDAALFHDRLHPDIVDLGLQQPDQLLLTQRTFAIDGSLLGLNCDEAKNQNHRFEQQSSGDFHDEVPYLFKNLKKRKIQPTKSSTNQITLRSGAHTKPF
jgi:hypothetical protein